MKTTTTIALAVLLAAVATQDAAAQWNNARFGGGRNRIYMSVGLDPAVITSIGYARVVPVLGHDFQIGTDVGVVTAKPDVKDFRARIEFQSTVLKHDALELTGSAAFITRGTSNVVYSGINFGADFTGSLGIYKQGWFAATQFGKDKAIISRIIHTDWYRENVYEGARDGWYLNAGGTFHYGLMGGVTMGRTELVGRAGYRRLENWDQVSPPFYGSLGFGVPF